jgi:hypothetical protein
MHSDAGKFHRHKPVIPVMRQLVPFYDMNKSPIESGIAVCKINA